MNWKLLKELFEEFILPYPEWIPTTRKREIEQLYKDIKAGMEKRISRTRN